MAVKCWQVGPGFGIEQLHQAEFPPETLGPGQVRVRIRAVSLNYRDLLVIQGKYNPKQPLPLVPCSDAAAEVVEVGPECDEFKVGDRVCPIFAQGWQSGPLTRSVARTTLGSPRPGTLRQEAVFQSSGLVRIPSHLTWEEAACLPCAGVTAWNALFDQAPVLTGDRVVVLGTGGVSIFALQFALQAGLRVAVTSSSEQKLNKVRKMGAEFTVNYREEPEWGRKILEWSEGEGVAKVIEVGGAGTFAQSVRCLRPGGQIALIGVLAGIQQELNLMPVLMQQISVQGILVGPRSSFVEMNRALEANRIRPVVDCVYPFTEAPEAIKYLASGQHLGKVCIQVC